ncbi:MAG TPA: proline--tRNA ligase [Syntrophaceae bacterium]|nr:proline--tRNA ligase [Syntrophaceae bacterium]
MRRSSMFLPTLREAPAEAEVPSHKLMLRAGMIRKLASGIYSYLPLGLRVIRKVERIIREEMDRAGAQEVLLPAIQPRELWDKSGRWNVYGKELLRFKDRHDHHYCIAPTHEEVITDVVRREVRSYRQLPLILYQIQTKFRDEIRPRFGIMRGREFGMKDAYSFDADDEGAEKSYQRMYEAYCRIFKRCGLKFKVVEAETGPIGGSFSHEFMVLADTGEDAIVSCSECHYAANAEKAEVTSPDPASSLSTPLKPLEKVYTPEIKAVSEVSEFLGVFPQELVKTLIFQTDDGVVAALVRGDHEINHVKLRNFLGSHVLELADEQTIVGVTGAPVGFAGAIGLHNIRIIADNAIRGMRNFVMGANEKDFHYINVNLDRDFKVDSFGDVRMITSQDRCPKCGGLIQFFRGIEVGHVFKLGTKYSEALNATYLDKEGKERLLVMGCYGIGVGRTVAAAIEQNHDSDGIIFPITIAPFQVIILPLDMSDRMIAETAESLYKSLISKEIEVLLDDRQEWAGIKFKDGDLIGIPIRVTIGRKTLDKGSLEVTLRSKRATHLVKPHEAPSFIEELIKKEIYDQTE